MFRGDQFTKPKPRSVIAAALIAGGIYVGSHVSYVFGYLAALLSMLILVVAMQMESIWPRRRKQENSLVFALFWGCMLGAVLPFLVTTFLEGGFSALYALLLGDG